jgi:hypothetical protein
MIVFEDLVDLTYYLLIAGTSHLTFTLLSASLVKAGIFPTNRNTNAARHFEECVVRLEQHAVVIIEICLM